MYGIVNKAIKDLIIENFDEATWKKIKDKSGVDIDFFLSDKGYDDAVTYDLAFAAADVLNIPVSEVLFLFGEYWILNTGMKNYGSLMEAGGDTLQDFLENLPNFHSRVMLMFPNLAPPEFRISDIGFKDLKVHYYSHRESLQDFVRGLLSGLGKMFDTPVNVSLVEGKHTGLDHDIFHVTWN